MIDDITEWMNENEFAHDFFKMENAARKILGRTERPPGPATILSPISLLAFFNDQINTLQWLYDAYGDYAYVRVAHLHFYMIHDPDLIEEVLLKNNSSFHKDDFIELLREVLGDGLLTSEGEEWRKHRKIAAPALKRKQIAAYAEDMVHYTREASASIEDGAEVDVWEMMMGLTLRIVVKTLFGLEMPERVKEVGEAIEQAMEYFDAEANSAWQFVPKSLPSPQRKKFVETMKKLDEIIYDLIMERRRGEEGDDLLWRLLEARYEDGTPMSTQQVRDEALTMFIAGHETTALATTFALDHLARNPQAAARLKEELDEVLGARDATLEDVRALPYTEAVIKETMRLTPPAWIIGRRAIEDVQIGDYLIPEGSQVIMSQWLLHRDERYFEDAHAFKPERWLGGELEKELPRYVYFPFGGGQRVCIGNHFAMMEAILMIAGIFKEWDFALTNPAPIEYSPVITLRPTGPVVMKATRREH